MCRRYLIPAAFDDLIVSICLFPYHKGVHDIAIIIDILSYVWTVCSVGVIEKNLGTGFLVLYLIIFLNYIQSHNCTNNT